MNDPSWAPLSPEKLSEIRAVFNEIFPVPDYGNLSEKISEYWIGRLHAVWKDKPEPIKKKDLGYNPSDPLSRILPKTVVIAYADSVQHGKEYTLAALDRFISGRFSSVSGLHILPACVIAENRFNDGYFSQVERSRIHPRFGTNDDFARIIQRYFSMADFVLNHVDIENPHFKAYLDGVDEEGKNFFVFTESEYEKQIAEGAFDRIFRPRPFPLFSIFRRKPVDPLLASLSYKEKIIAVKKHLLPDAVDNPVIGILSVFDKIKNDQMLFSEDYDHITEFRDFLEHRGRINPDSVFTLSEIQETRQPPYIFRQSIRTRADLLSAIGYGFESSRRIADSYTKIDPMVFGEPIRAMTTFSHVQIDVNTSTFEGLKMLADDFSWYLGLDLNMLRLDAANYAFKKWKTSCFGLPEVKGLMKILYLSIDAVAPRMVANLEVNDQLSAILSQMADPAAPPPMMYDFHLACIVPAVFNMKNSEILMRVPKLQSKFTVSKTGIRFSVAESHDGKSVRGSLDLLTISERYKLAETVIKNGGRIKYKSVPQGVINKREFERICREAGIDYEEAVRKLFAPVNEDSACDSPLKLKDHIKETKDIAKSLNQSVKEFSDYPSLLFLSDKLLYGREPYELCISTRDSLSREENPEVESRRYLAFYTLAFAMMGRNVRSLFFNDLMGLANDYQRMEATGELRDIKRTRSEFSKLEKKLMAPGSINGFIAEGMNQLIDLIDSEPSLGPRGSEAEPLDTGDPEIAMVHNRCGANHSLALVNLSTEAKSTQIDTKIYRDAGIEFLEDRFTGEKIEVGPDQIFGFTLEPFGRKWFRYHEQS